MNEQRKETGLRDLSCERVETNRLLMVPVSMEYAAQMFSELTDEITKYMSFDTPKSIDETADFVNQSLGKISKGTDLIVVILDKQTREFLGGAGVHNINTRAPELGVWVKKTAHGKKVGREAVTGLKRWADENIDCDFYQVYIHKDNIPSRKIAESLGGEVTSSCTRIAPSGKSIDELIYHIS